MEYYELVVEGPYLLVKGFMEGRLTCTDYGEIFFSKEEHIKRETLADKLKEWLGVIENLVHVIVDEKSLPAWEQLFSKEGNKVGIELKSKLKIENAYFDFEMEAFTPKHGEELKKYLKELPGDVEVVGKEEKEEFHDVKEKGIYTPDHPYELFIKGTLVGNVKTVVETYRKWHKNSLITLEEIHLTLEKI